MDALIIEAIGPRPSGRLPTPGDDQRGDHAEHAVEALDVGQDVAVEGPHARAVAVDDGVPALARVDAQGVAVNSADAQRSAVARHDALAEAVGVPRVHHHALVHEADEDPLALLGDDGRGGREAVAVDGEAAQRVVVDEDDVLGHAVLVA